MEQLIQYFQFPFVRHAVIVGVLVSVCASLLGITLVLKRYSYIGDGLSHVAFGAMTVATIINVTNSMLVVLPITILAAVLLLQMGQNAKIKGDAALAMISVGALACGYLFLNVFSTSSNIAGDVCSTLFGSTKFLTLTSQDVITCVVLSIVVIVLYLLFFNKIFAITFDEDFANASGIRTKLYNFLIAAITAIVIVLAMRLVGSLLITALVIFPAVSAMRIFKNFKSVVIFASVLSSVCAFLGICVSIVMGTPVGATIVITDIVAFMICALIKKILRR